MFIVTRFKYTELFQVCFNSLLLSCLLPSFAHPLLSSSTAQSPRQFKSLAFGQNVSDISPCNSFISLFLSCSTCCHLRKLRRDYCNWPTPTWDHWWLRWTNYTAGYRHFCFYFGSTFVSVIVCIPYSLYPFFTLFLCLP